MGLNFLEVQLYSEAAFNSLAPGRWERWPRLAVRSSTAAGSTHRGTGDAPAQSRSGMVAAETGLHLVVCPCPCSETQRQRDKE